MKSLMRKAHVPSLVHASIVIIRDPTYWRYNSDGEYEYRSDWSEDN